jgi:hypothetical protein
MNPRLSRRLVLWLLPLLAVRALVPAGFMLSAGANGLELQFCPAQGTALVQALASVRGRQDGSHVHGVSLAADPGATHAHHHSGGHEASYACPYALAAAGIAIAIPDVSAVAPGPSDERVELVSPPSGTSGPVRADRIRGPPFNS